MDFSWGFFVCFVLFLAVSECLCHRFCKYWDQPVVISKLLASHKHPPKYSAHVVGKPPPTHSTRWKRFTELTGLKLTRYLSSKYHGAPEAPTESGGPKRNQEVQNRTIRFKTKLMNPCFDLTSGVGMKQNLGSYRDIFHHGSSWWSIRWAGWGWWGQWHTSNRWTSPEWRYRPDLCRLETQKTNQFGPWAQEDKQIPTGDIFTGVTDKVQKSWSAGCGAQLSPLGERWFDITLTIQSTRYWREARHSRHSPSY